MCVCVRALLCRLFFFPGHAAEKDVGGAEKQGLDFFVPEKRLRGNCE